MREFGGAFTSRLDSRLAKGRILLPRHPRSVLPKQVSAATRARARGRKVTVRVVITPDACHLIARVEALAVERIIRMIGPPPSIPDAVLIEAFRDEPPFAVEFTVNPVPDPAFTTVEYLEPLANDGSGICLIRDFDYSCLHLTQTRMRAIAAERQASAGARRSTRITVNTDPRAPLR